VCASAGKAVFPLLHIDDNEDDRLLIREAIALTKTPLALYQAAELNAAIPYFKVEKEGKEAKEYPRPALVLLDCDLGDQNGADFLYWLRLMKKQVSIPVVMFSGLAGERNVAECYEQGATYFLRKAMGLTSLKVVVRGLYQSLKRKIPRPILRLPEYVPDPRTKGADVAVGR